MEAGQFSHHQRNLKNKKNDINNFKDEICKEKKVRFLLKLNINVLTDEEESCNQKQLHFDILQLRVKIISLIYIHDQLCLQAEQLIH